MSIKMFDLDSASNTTSCIVFPVISSIGINSFARVDIFSTPSDAQHCSISMILNPIAAGKRTGSDTCMINLAPFSEFLKSNGLIDCNCEKLPSLVWIIGPRGLLQEKVIHWFLCWNIDWTSKSTGARAWRILKSFFIQNPFVHFKLQFPSFCAL